MLRPKRHKLRKIIGVLHLDLRLRGALPVFQEKWVRIYSDQIFHRTSPAFCAAKRLLTVSKARMSCIFRHQIKFIRFVSYIEIFWYILFKQTFPISTNKKKTDYQLFCLKLIDVLSGALNKAIQTQENKLFVLFYYFLVEWKWECPLIDFLLSR